MMIPSLKGGAFIYLSSTRHAAVAFACPVFSLLHINEEERKDRSRRERD
jgi:hypothetical protein